MAAVAQYMGWTDASASDTPSMYANDSGIYWLLTVDGVDSDGGHYYSGMATVDAVTGEVLGCSMPDHGPALGLATAVSAKPKPGGQVELRKLIASAPHSSIQWLGKGTIKLTIDGRVCILKVGESKATQNGKVIRLHGKLTIKNGRVLAPSNFLNQLRAKPRLRP